MTPAETRTTPPLSVLVQCTGKDRLTGAQAQQMAKRPGKQFSPYLCPICRHWHVGHYPAKPFRRRKHP